MGDFLRPIRNHKRRVNEQRLASFDIETSHGRKNFFYSCGIMDCDHNFFYYTDKNAAILKLYQLAKTHDYIYATNLNFDYEGLFSGTSAYTRHTPVYSGSRLIGVKLKVGNRSVWLSDTLNFLMAGVAKLGDAVGVPKLDPPACLGRLPRNRKEKEELRVYNRRDCEVSLLFMELLHKEIRKLGGRLQLTSASTSLWLWRRKYLKGLLVKESLVLNDPEILDFIREAYYGGRTEVFRRGLITEELNYYDINSMYPAAMRRRFPLPNSARLFKGGKRNLIPHFMGVSEVTVRSPPGMTIPFLPYRNKDGRLIFPTGTFKGVFTHEDINAAVREGYEILQCHKTLIYRKTWEPFREYIDTLYALRNRYKEEGNPAELAVKILMNSLYGKFAQHHITETEFFLPEETLPDDAYFIRSGEKTPQKTLYETEEIKYTVERKECESDHVFPILSAYVTSYARGMLFDYLKRCDPVYCDTDSIVTRTELPCSTRLGDMKLEARLKRCLYIRPKLYLYEDVHGKVVIKTKGVPRISEDIFKSALEGKTIRYDKILKTKEAYRRGLRPNMTKRVFKRLNLEDEKRRWPASFDPEKEQHSEPIHI